MSNPSHSKLQYICRTCFRADCPTLNAPAHERYDESTPDSLLPVRGVRLTAAGEDCYKASRQLRAEYALGARCGGQDACKCSEAVSVRETTQDASERLPARAPCPTCPDVPGGPAYCPECDGKGSIQPFYYENKLEQVPNRHEDSILFTGTYESFMAVGDWMRRRGSSGIELSYGMRGDCWFLRDQLFPGTRVIYLSPGVFRVIHNQ